MEISQLPAQKPEKEPMNLKKLSFFLKLYVISLIALGIFIATIFNVVIPKAKLIFRELDTVEAKEAEITLLKSEISSLGELSEQSINTDLQTLDKITPTTDIQVVLFRNKIVDLAEKEGLEVVFQNISKKNDEKKATPTGSATTTPVITTNPGSIDLTTATAQNQAESSGLSMLDIPVSFKTKGSFDKIENFLMSLSEIDDLVIIRDMSLTRDKDTDIWNLDIQFIKYQFVERDTASQAYKAVPIGAKLSPEVRTYLDGKK